MYTALKLGINSILRRRCTRDYHYRNQRPGDSINSKTRLLRSQPRYVCLSVSPFFSLSHTHLPHSAFVHDVRDSNVCSVPGKGQFELINESPFRRGAFVGLEQGPKNCNVHFNAWICGSTRVNMLSTTAITATDWNKNNINNINNNNKANTYKSRAGHKEFHLPHYTSFNYHLETHQF